MKEWESLEESIRRLEEAGPPPPWAGFLGASPRPSECRMVLIPVPWDATVSYGAGTARGPEAILGASHQLDLDDSCFDRPFRAGITMLPYDKEILALAPKAREKAARVIESSQPHDLSDQDIRFVNEASERVNSRVHALAQEYLGAGKLVGLVGGDHSSPYGLIRALGMRYADGFSILHFDAHHDLRAAYEDFTHSHASIMFNVMENIPSAHRLVQVGIRDYSRDEKQYAAASHGRIITHYGRDIFSRKARGENWDTVCEKIISDLTDKVYVSFDIDGLDPSYCPSTGTPVPGGLSYDEAIHLIEHLALSGKQIIGFDLCEVTPATDGSEWDANVGARILYKLAGATLYSNNACKLAGA